eukprot:1175871-Prorocentrum_minimum.AAC.2
MRNHERPPAPTEGGTQSFERLEVDWGVGHGFVVGLVVVPLLLLTQGGVTNTLSARRKRSSVTPSSGRHPLWGSSSGSTFHEGTPSGSASGCAM